LNSLKFELEFLENGGYGRSVHTPWRPTSTFQDSLTLVIPGFQILDGIPIFIQRNEMTRYLLSMMLGTDEVEKLAFGHPTELRDAALAHLYEVYVPETCTSAIENTEPVPSHAPDFVRNVTAEIIAVAVGR
jgi:hypothetical protein